MRLGNNEGVSAVKVLIVLGLTLTTMIGFQNCGQAVNFSPTPEGAALSKNGVLTMCEPGDDCSSEVSSESEPPANPMPSNYSENSNSNSSSNNSSTTSTNTSTTEPNSENVPQEGTEPTQGSPQAEESEESEFVSCADISEEELEKAKAFLAVEQVNVCVHEKSCQALLSNQVLDLDGFEFTAILDQVNNIDLVPKLENSYFLLENGKKVVMEKQAGAPAGTKQWPFHSEQVGEKVRISIDFSAQKFGDRCGILPPNSRSGGNK